MELGVRGDSREVYEQKQRTATLVLAEPRLPGLEPSLKCNERAARIPERAVGETKEVMRVGFWLRGSSSQREISNVMPRGHKRKFTLYCLRFWVCRACVSARAGCNKVGVCLCVTKVVGATYVPHESARWHRYDTYHIIERDAYAAVSHFPSDCLAQLQHRPYSAFRTRLKKFLPSAGSPGTYE